MQQRGQGQVEAIDLQEETRMSEQHLIRAPNREYNAILTHTLRQVVNYIKSIETRCNPSDVRKIEKRIHLCLI